MVLAQMPEHESKARTDSSAQTQIHRPARILLGWMTEESALHSLNGNAGDARPTDQQRAAVAAAHEAVARRLPGIDQTEVLRDPPHELDTHIEALRQRVPDFFTEGWRVQLVDLTRVCAFQPTVYLDSAAERIGDVEPGDLTALARISLPTESSEQLHAEFDPGRNTFMLTSRNPNLRLMGHFAGPIKAGAPPAFGFFVTITASMLQVAEYHGRHFLRDGYHRAVGLLTRGIKTVPVFTRAFTAVKDFLPANMLPQEAIFGHAPPVLPDYLNDLVSAEALLPATQKLLIIQGTELAPTI